MCGIFLCLSNKANTASLAERYGSLIELLAQRGPDFSQSSSFDLGQYEVFLFSSVLDLRGSDLVRQPIIADGDFLQFNGELYEIEEDAEFLESTENDGLYLMRRLADCSDEQDVLNVIGSLRGEFSFIYWSSKLKTLYFGRDYFGRRSLCWNIDWNIDSEQISSGLDIAGLDFNLCISSVAYYADQQSWTEVPARGVYKLCLHSDQVNRVQLIPWQSNASTGAESDASGLPQEDLSQSAAILRSPIHRSFTFDLLDEVQIQDEKIMSQYELDFLGLLKKAVELKVTKQNFRCRKCSTAREQVHNTRDQSTCTHACLAVLFSGGLDSTVLALLADEFVPKNRPIDLINLAFCSNAPDRQTGWSSYLELKRIAPDRAWNFVAVDVTAEELTDWREKSIKKIIYPLKTVLDDSIGCAMFFAATGKGRLVQEDLVQGGQDTGQPVDQHPSVDYETTSKVLLLGQGADEQLAGYARHRTSFRIGGWEALQREMNLDVCRISSRNLGRDDRMISTNGREARYPFLDENVVNFLNALPTNVKCDPNRPRGEGDKRLLRLVAKRIGLTECCTYEKRAIQFGSKIAKLENKKEKAGNFNKLKFDYLFFDLNHLIYITLQNEEVREQVDIDPQMLDRFFEKFFNYIRCVIELVQPDKLVYFAFDGVSPKAKHRAQLNRRLSKSLLKELNGTGGFNFDSVVVGTEFMHRIHLEFEQFVESLRVEQSKSYPGRKIEYSSCYSAGEGEFKIFEYIDRNRLDKNANCALHGRDSDYLIYGLASKLVNMFIISKRIEMKCDSPNETSRDKHSDSLDELNGANESGIWAVNDGTFVSFDIIDMNHVRVFLLGKLEDEQLNLPDFDEGRIICDLIAITLLLGTDYLLPVPGLAKLNDEEDGFLRLIKRYAQFLNAAVGTADGGHLTSEDIGFNYNNLKLYIKSIEHLESVGTSSNEFLNLKHSYYRDVGVLNKRAIDREVMRELTTAYLEAMYFNLQLYYCNLLSWDFAHDRFWPPMLSDFEIEPENVKLTHEVGLPMSPLVFLLHILPRESIELMPTEFDAIKNKFVSCRRPHFKFNKKVYPRKFTYFNVQNSSRKSLERLAQPIIDRLSSEAGERNVLRFD